MGAVYSYIANEIDSKLQKQIGQNKTGHVYISYCVFLGLCVHTKQFEKPDLLLDTLEFGVIAIFENNTVLK